MWRCDDIYPCLLPLGGFCIRDIAACEQRPLPYFGDIVGQQARGMIFLSVVPKAGQLEQRVLIEQSMHKTVIIVHLVGVPVANGPYDPLQLGILGTQWIIRECSLYGVFNEMASCWTG